MLSHVAPLTHKTRFLVPPLNAFFPPSLLPRSLAPRTHTFCRAAVVAFSEEFVDVVNPMAMLLLLASFTSGKVKRVELYKPQKLTKTANGNVLFRAHGEYM